MGIVLDLKTRQVWIPPVRQIFTGPNEIAVELCERFNKQLVFPDVRTGNLSHELRTYWGSTHTGIMTSNQMPFPVPCWMGYSGLKTGRTYSLHCSNKTDPFMWMDRRFKCTLWLLEYCKQNKISLDISTQSDLIACSDYADTLDKSWKITLCFRDHLGDEQFDVEYPGCPSQLRLKKAYEKLKNLGLNVHMGVI